MNKTKIAGTLHLPGPRSRFRGGLCIKEQHKNQIQFNQLIKFSQLISRTLDSENNRETNKLIKFLSIYKKKV